MKWKPNDYRQWKGVLTQELVMSNLISGMDWYLILARKDKEITGREDIALSKL